MEPQVSSDNPFPFFFAKTGKILHKVNYHDVIWIETDANYCTLYLEGKKYAVKSSLVRILENFPSHLFLQIHRNYAVRLDAIQHIDLLTSEVKLKDGTVLPIGRHYKPGLSTKLNIL